MEWQSLVEAPATRRSYGLGRKRKFTRSSANNQKAVGCNKRSWVRDAASCRGCDNQPWYIFSEGSMGVCKLPWHKQHYWWICSRHPAHCSFKREITKPSKAKSRSRRCFVLNGASESKPLWYYQRSIAQYACVHRICGYKKQKPLGVQWTYIFMPDRRRFHWENAAVGRTKHFNISLNKTIWLRYLSNTLPQRWKFQCLQRHSKNLVFSHCCELPWEQLFGCYAGCTTSKANVRRTGCIRHRPLSC